MDNQHRKISGYRDLSQAEVDLLNEIKDVEDTALELIERLRHGTDSVENVPTARWVAIGQTHIQQGFMALCRSVAKPGRDTEE